MTGVKKRRKKRRGEARRDKLLFTQEARPT
jgi:hypothetical protein